MINPIPNQLKPSPGGGMRRKIFMLSLPMVITSFSLSVMHLTDALFLSKLGTETLAAITTPALLIALIAAFGRAYLLSVTTFVSQCHGGDREAASRCGSYAWQGIFAALFIGLLSLIYWPTAAVVLGFFNHEIALLELEVTYFRLSLLSIPGELVGLAIANYFIGINRPTTAMTASIAGVTLNIVTSYLLIFGAFGWSGMGIAGAAWGTVIAVTLEALALLFIFLHHLEARRHRTRVVHFSKLQQRRMFRLGLPAAVQGTFDILSWGVALIWLISHFGTNHIAAATVLIRCMHLTFMPAEGVATVMVSLVGNAIGAHQPQRAIELARKGFQLIAVYMTSMALLYYFMRGPIMRTFSDESAVIAIGMSCMIWVALFQFFDALNIAYIHSLHGAGDNKWPSIANITLSLVILLGGGLFMIHRMPHLESYGIWMITAIYVALQGLIFWGRWRCGAWQKINIFSGAVAR